MNTFLKDRGVQIGTLAAVSALASALVQDTRLSRVQRTVAYMLIAALSAVLAAKVLERPFTANRED